MAETLRSQKSAPEFARAYQNLVDRLVAGHAGEAAPKVGDDFPDFALPDDNGRLMTFDALSAGKTLIIGLNRGHWCSYCRIELEGLQENLGEIERRGANVVAITPDRQDYARRLRERCRLTFPLLSDIGNGFALSLGLAVWCGDEIRALYMGSGTDLSVCQGDGGWLIPIPATYVVSPDRRIKASYVNPDFRQRMQPEAILAAI